MPLQEELNPESAEGFGVQDIKQKYHMLPVGLLRYLADHVDKALSNKDYVFLLKTYKNSIAKLPRGEGKKVFYRGIRFQRKNKKLLKELLLGKKLKPLRLFESWSSELVVAEEFGPLIFKKEIPIDQRLVYLPELVSDYEFSYENELLAKGQILSIENLVFNAELTEEISDFFSVKEIFEIYKSTPSSQVQKFILKKIKDELFSGSWFFWMPLNMKKDLLEQLTLREINVILDEDGTKINDLLYFYTSGSPKVKQAIVLYFKERIDLTQNRNWSVLPSNLKKALEKQKKLEEKYKQNDVQIYKG